jgi:outer membrane protein OmpA-like peptidoglycan-associated protein
MKSIVSRAPAVAVLLAGSAVIATACGGSQKELTAPQQAAAQAEDQAQKAQEQAQKARETANKTQKELDEAQQTHDEARQAELAADQHAQVATRQAQIAEQQAAMSSPPQPKPAAPQAQAAPPAGEQKGVAEAQGQHADHDSTGKLVIITTSLLFKTNSAELLDSSKPDLDQVADALNAQPKGNTVKVQGYTDSTGSVDVNEALSQKRAEAVADYLESKGVAPERISAKGFGDQDPVSTEKTAEGRALNRRVDLIVEPAEGRANTQAPDNQQQQQNQQKQDQQKQDQQKQDQQKQQ